MGLDLSPTTQVNLIGINDFHGRIDANTVRFAGTVEQLRAQYGEENSLFISNGDNIGASVFASSYFGDKPTIDVLNALDLKASAAGNHEFDKGAADLTGRVDALADFPYLAANVYKDGEPLLPEYAIFEVDGVRVGVVGAITESTPTLVTPSGIQGIEFREPVAEVNRVVAEIDDQVDVIVAQYHEGSGAGEKTTTLEQAVASGGPFAAIVNETSPEVDAIFTGHTHQLYAWNAPIPGREGTRPIVQTGNYGENVGQIVLDVDAQGDVVDYTARNVARLGGKDAAANTALDAELIRTYPRVATVDGIVKAARAEADVVGQTPVGSVAADITTAFSGGSYVDGVYTGGTRGDRTKQSALGGLVADALLDSLDDADRGGAEVSFVNAGGLRDELLYGTDGVVTLAEANAVLPFLNNLWTTTLTGEQLRQVLEQQWGDFSKRADNANLSLGVSENLRYTYDASLPAGQRVTGVWIDGLPVDPAQGYRVGSFNFLLGGGDSFSVFAQGTDTRDSGLIDRDAWIAYLQENLGLTPDFTARGVQVSGAAQPAAPGSDLTVTVSNLNLTSLGAPANTTLDASFGTETVSPRATARTVAFAAPSARIAALAAPASTSVSVIDGSATVTVGVPADAVGTLQLRLTAQPTGTAVVVPVRVAAAGDGVGTPGGSAGQGQGGSSQAGTGALPLTGTDTAWMGAGVLAALALLGLGLVARRRETRQAD